MNRLIRFLSVCLLLSFVFPVQAKVEGVTNEPNQVYLFPIRTVTDAAA